MLQWREKEGTAQSWSLRPQHPRYLLPQRGATGAHGPKAMVTCHAPVHAAFQGTSGTERALLTQRKEARQAGPELCAPVFRVPLKISQGGMEFLQRQNMGTTGKKEKLYVTVFLIR